MTATNDKTAPMRRALWPERSTEEWQDLDRRHYLHPFTDFKALSAEGARIIEHAEGPYIYDSGGNRILDGMAGLWCCNLGYGRRELADAAFQQMQALPYYNSFFKTAHPPAIELASQLVQLTPPQFNHVYFTGSGSDANDTIIRMVRRYWDLLGQPQRATIISRENAYHGSTMAGASLGGMKPMHAQGGLPIPGIVHIEQPYWYENGGDMSPAEYGLRGSGTPRGQDRGTRGAKCRRVHRRATARRWWRDHSSCHVLARSRTNLSTLRHPPDRR